ncbi:MAG: hypothetical protein JRI54_11660 [Deltaproteobacteria bacterium]|nr:hypothetical protein [Deltaproteobacteria bacterium]
MGYLTPVEIRERKRVIANLEAVLKNSVHSIYKSERNIDRKAIMEKIRENKKVLNERTAPRVSGLEKNRLLRRAEELEKKIKQGMLTKDEFMGTRKTNDYGHKYQEASEENIRKEMRWQVEKAPLVREWQKIMRIIDPDNPNSSNVERLRPNKRRS